MHRIYHLCYLATCVLMLASCGMIDLAYNKAPTFVASEFDKAFDLNEAQSKQLNAGLAEFFAWHRERELIRYQQFLDHAALVVSDGITATEFLQLNRDLRLAWRRSLEKAIDSLADLALTLESEQIDHYQKYYLEDSEEFSDYLAKSEQQREIYRVRRGTDLLEDWFGNFAIDQEEKIMARLQQLPDFYLPWIDFREARQQALISAFSNATDAGLTRRQLKTILLDPATEYARTFESARQSFWQAYAVALEDISALLTKGQRQRAVNRLKEYSRAAARLQNQG